MSFILVNTSNMRYENTPTSISKSNLYYDDLVKTAKMDENRGIPHLERKYIAPTVNKEGIITQNSIFLKALIEAGVPEIVLETENSTTLNPALFPQSSQNTIKRVIDNYLFFENPPFKDKPGQINEAFMEFDYNLRESLKRQSRLLPKLEIKSIEYDITPPDIITYNVNGITQSSEYKELINKPHMKLIERLEQYFGPIRSINGIKPQN